MRETERPTRGGVPRDYPEDQVQQVRDLYAAGHTQDEIALKLGTTQKTIWRLMRNHSIQTRPPIKRDQRGEKNSTWRGPDATYAAFHKRVEVARGRPQSCAACDTQDPETAYEWANLSGRYDEINDYVRLCIPCHRKVDAHRRKVTGMSTSPRGGDAACSRT